MEDGVSVLLDLSPSDNNEETTTKTNNVYESLRIFSTACDRKDVIQLKNIISNTAVLRQNKIHIHAKIFDKLEDTIKFRNEVIDLLLTEAYNEFQNDISELFFLSAGRFEIDRLKKVIENLGKDLTYYKDNINQTKDSDSVILFVLKYGNIENENFMECMKILLDAGVDIIKFDMKGKFAFDYIALLYNEYVKIKTDVANKLIEVAELFLKKGIYAPDNNNNKTLDFLTKVMKTDMENYTFLKMNDATKLFHLITKNKTEEFIASPKAVIQNFKDIDTEENTLLQLASKKTDHMLPVVQHLLRNGADPNKVTKNNQLTPLELAAFNNNQKIFEEILRNKKTVVDQRQYNNFVRWRSQPMKVKLFETLLESNKLDPSFSYDKRGNTPLHYAIMFSHKKAIQNQLRRQSSLVIKNNSNKSALDLIDSEDLEKFFDSCLALDNYIPYFTDVNYKMRFRFGCLVDATNSREVQVVAKIGKHRNLEHLLTHPFIHTFITLKWFRIKIYFKITLIIQAIIFLLLSVFFYCIRDAGVVEPTRILCILFTSINIVLKAPIFLYFKIENRVPVFYALQRANLHGSMEILLMITTIGSFFQNQFRAFLFIEMAISFLLTAGYHPRLSKWSLMLQRVFQTFSILLIFFSLIIVAFSLGFHILFPHDFLFSNITSSVFRTFVMTTGEFNIGDDTNFEDSGTSGYILFLLFAMSTTLVIVNFWTGVAVTDIERIERNSAINACKNVTLFMLFIDYIYSNKYARIIRKYIPNPLLFLKIDERGTIFHNPEKCEVDFFVNKKRQFEEKGHHFPPRVDEECFNKISSHYYKLAKVTTEQQVLNKLEEISKAIDEIKMKINFKNEGHSTDSKHKKDFRKKK